MQEIDLILNLTEVKVNLRNWSSSSLLVFLWWKFSLGQPYLFSFFAFYLLIFWWKRVGRQEKPEEKEKEETKKRSSIFHFKYFTRWLSPFPQTTMTIQMIILDNWNVKSGYRRELRKLLLILTIYQVGSEAQGVFYQ